VAESDSDNDTSNDNGKTGGGVAMTSIEMTALPVTPDRPSVEAGTVPLHRHVLNQFRDAQRNLLSIRSLGPLINYLVDGLPAAFASAGAELRLHDPEGSLARLLRTRAPAAKAYSLHKDSYALYELFDDSPAVAYLDLEDSRMFRLLSGERDASGAVLMPLMDGNRLIGTYLLGLVEDMSSFSDPDLEVFALLGQLVAAAFLQVVEYQRADSLALLDHVTEVGNYRAFTRDLEREIQWARRSGEPLSLIMLSLDEIEEIARTHGEIASHFVQRRVSQRLCSDLRATDYIARLDETRFAILLPACNEPNAYDIGERMRQDIDDFAMDDGRGSVLYVTLSVGIVCWEPSRHPSEDVERLAMQLDSEAETAMFKSVRAGGNRISVARVGLLMV
jgi:diguanylate cyclase (GGDEF)-like protein